jgi:hypothetical protein
VSKAEGVERGRTVRWLLATLVALAGVAFWLYALADKPICHDALYGAATRPICEGPRLLDLLPFALLVAVLLAPDVSELGVPGILSLKRRVNEQSARQESMQRQLESVSLQLQSVSQNVSVHVGSAVLDQRQVAQSIQEKEPQFEPTERHVVDEGGPGNEEFEPGEQESLASVDPDSTDRLSLVHGLGSLWQSLGQYAEISRTRETRPDIRMAHLDEESQKRVDRWYWLYRDELAAVGGVWRSALLDLNGVPIPTLQDAVRNGRELLRILLAGLDLPHGPHTT